MHILEILGVQYRFLGLFVSCLVADVPYCNLLSSAKGPYKPFRPLKCVLQQWKLILNFPWRREINR